MIVDSADCFRLAASTAFGQRPEMWILYRFKWASRSSLALNGTESASRPSSDGVRRLLRGRAVARRDDRDPPKQKCCEDPRFGKVYRSAVAIRSDVLVHARRR